MVIWQVAGWDGVSPSPLGHILEGSTIGFLRVVVMLAGSLLSYRYISVPVLRISYLIYFRHMTTIWSAELTGLHRGRAFATATGVCSLPWKNKAIYMVSGYRSLVSIYFVL